MTDDIFLKIINKEAQTKLIYQDEFLSAFFDINKKAPTHILIVPNKKIPTLNDITQNDEALLGKMLLQAAKIAKEQNIAKSGYRLVINCNQDAGQEVFHLHMHLLGGAKLKGL